MTNKEIAKQFDLISRLLALHEGNPFKIRSYQGAYNNLRQISDSLEDLTIKELVQIPSVGKGLAEKILDLNNTGTFPALDEILSKTPVGVLDLMMLKGLGPKKVRLIWKELGVESLGELEYAIKENRLTLLKGFGTKTQESIIDQIAFFNSVNGFHLINKAENVANNLLSVLRDNFTDELFDITGDLRRFMPIVSSIDIISTIGYDEIKNRVGEIFELKDSKILFQNIEIIFIKSTIESFGSDLFESTGPKTFTEKFSYSKISLESEVFKENGKQFISPVYRDGKMIVSNHDDFIEDKYIQIKDIKGVIHNHTVWSDGSDKVIDMAKYYKQKGYKYMVVTDHSKSAFYANGLREDQIEYYLEDIANANARIDGFQIFSGIESDILMDGSLDYNSDILDKFDVVIASIHSVLRMEKEKATLRLITAIENPYTKILGHMTGRILLAREGYPLDYNKIFESCVKNNVVMELNANPHRLDIDWTLISKAQEMGVKISINPDAHNKKEVDYIKYGVLMAQKGGLLRENCLNVKSVEEFEEWMK